MKIAIIGSGISGLVSAYLLSQKYEVTLFEKEAYLGGHTRTEEVAINGKKFNIDAGFIVFNEKTYPNFIKILEKEKIAFETTEMSFSFLDPSTNFEYNGHSFASLFSQKQNLINPKFYKMLYDVLKFNIVGKRAVKNNRYLDDKLLSFVECYSFGGLFKFAYLFPMAQAIWSSPYQDVTNFSTRFILNFFYNHGLLDIFNRPRWYVIKNGSKNYIPKLIARCQNSIKLNCPVTKISRYDKEVKIYTASQEYVFDKVVIATHSDQALALLEQPTQDEKVILSKIPYQENDICMHTDSSILPKNKKSWASWNFRKNDQNQCQLTYYMNRLQNINSDIDFCVSVNQNDLIAPEKVIKQFSLSHPVLTYDSIEAQKKVSSINGKNNTYFCGAYWGHGFHEDGVVSALKVCDQFGVTL